MNDENLRTLSPSEARAYGHLGGLASGKARRERKRLRECLEILLAMPCEDDPDVTHAERIAASLVHRAEHGDVRAFTAIRDTVGEMPSIRTEVRTEISEERRQEIEALLLGGDGDE